MTDTAPGAPGRPLIGLATITGPAISILIATTGAGTRMTAVGRNAIDTTKAGSAAPWSPIDETSDVRGRDVHPLAAGGPHSHRVGGADPADSGLAPRSARASTGTITGVPVLIASTGFTEPRITDGTEIGGWDPDRRPITGETIIALGRPVVVRPGDRMVPGTTARNGLRGTIGTGGSTGRGTTTHITDGCFPKVRRAATRGQAPGREDAAQDFGDRARSAWARIALEVPAVRWHE